MSVDSSATNENKHPNIPSSNSRDNNADSQELPNILKHLKQLEDENNDLKQKMKLTQEHNKKLSAKTREGMQSVLSTLLAKWMDACETKDEKVKADFKTGLENLVEKSAEENGVWQMVVAASSLHERQEHDLNKLQAENLKLKQQVDDLYGTSSSRVVESDNVGGKRKAEVELDRSDVQDNTDIWAMFQSSIV